MDHHSHAYPTVHRASQGIIVRRYHLLDILLHTPANHQLFHTQRPCRGGTGRRLLGRSRGPHFQRDDH